MDHPPHFNNLEKSALKINRNESQVRIELKCDHKSGILYIVPSDSSWVCKDQKLESHSISGFFSDLVKNGDEKTMDLMQKWGMYYMNNPIKNPNESKDS